MKSVILALVFTAIFAVALAGVAPIPEDLEQCNYICQKKDALVCASNDICLNSFSSLCEMQIYNCLNPQKQFRQIKAHKCNESFQPLCTRRDFH